MPKKIENFVMEYKIGAGQYGEVYKGYDKETGQEVAIKSMPRSLFQGKFKELFENEVRALKTCKNINIIKMIDIKRTSHNIYMILEYCNEGDLKDYLKLKGKLSEDEAVDFLIQILNAFKTLVKYNIMHRDFKPANVLKHNGIIKVADFGFCKLLGEEGKAMTMLGSPLNMAPEVLLGKTYDSKADIWSIGSVFYELLFGTPVYNVSDIKELVKLVHTYEIEIPKKGHTVSKVVEQVLREMLTMDPEKRITWGELFGHKINTYRDEKLKKDLNTSLNNSSKQNLRENMSKFYISTNRVVQHMQDYNKKSQINEYTRQLVKGTASKSLVYDGPAIQYFQDNDEKEETKIEDPKDSNSDTNSNNDAMSDLESSKVSTGTALLENRTKMIQKNSDRTLHERNKCAFLGSLADESSTVNLKLSEHAALVLMKKCNYMVDILKRVLQKGDKLLLKVYSLEQWETWIQTKEFENILKYITEEEEIFQAYYSSIVEKFEEKDKSDLDLIPKFKEIATSELDKEKQLQFEEVYVKVLTKYLGDVLNETNSPGRTPEDLRLLWQHADNLITALLLEETFAFKDELDRQFNFTKFYEELQTLDIDLLKKRVNQRLGKLKVL